MCFAANAGDTTTQLKLVFKGKVITATPDAQLSELGLAPGAKVIVMRGPPAPSTPSAGAGAEAGPSTAQEAAPSEVERILKAVEAVSSRVSNPDSQHFSLCDQVRTMRCRDAALSSQEPL